MTEVVTHSNGYRQLDPMWGPEATARCQFAAATSRTYMAQTWRTTLATPLRSLPIRVGYRMPKAYTSELVPLHSNLRSED